MFGNHLHRPGRVELGHHIKRPAVGQGGEKIAVIANAVADRRQAQNARMSADAQTAHGGNPSDAPLCCTLGDLHPLGQTRGAGGIENIGWIFRRWRNERRQCRTIPPAFGKILSTFNRAHRQQRRPFGQNSGHGLGQIRIGQNNGTGKGAVRDQLRHLRRRQARIDQGRHGAQAGQGQNDQTMFKKIRQHGGKPRARFDAPIRQPGGDDIDLPQSGRMSAAGPCGHRQWQDDPACVRRRTRPSHRSCASASPPTFLPVFLSALAAPKYLPAAKATLRSALARPSGSLTAVQ